MKEIDELFLPLEQRQQERQALVGQLHHGLEGYDMEGLVDKLLHIKDHMKVITSEWKAAYKEWRMTHTRVLDKIESMVIDLKTDIMLDSKPRKPMVSLHAPYIQNNGSVKTLTAGVNALDLVLTDKSFKSPRFFMYTEYFPIIEGILQKNKYTEEGLQKALAEIHQKKVLDVDKAIARYMTHSSIRFERLTKDIRNYNIEKGIKQGRHYLTSRDSLLGDIYLTAYFAESANKEHLTEVEGYINHFQTTPSTTELPALSGKETLEMLNMASKLIKAVRDRDKLIDRTMEANFNQLGDVEDMIHRIYTANVNGKGQLTAPAMEVCRMLGGLFYITTYNDIAEPLLDTMNHACMVAKDLYKYANKSVANLG